MDRVAKVQGCDGLGLWVYMVVSVRVLTVQGCAGLFV